MRRTNQITDINRATIYRILNQFCEDGIAHRIIAKNGIQFSRYAKPVK